MKNFGVFALALFIAICAIDISSAQSNNKTWGSRLPRDNLLHREILKKSSKLLKVVKDDYTFTSMKTISQIRVIDQYTNGKGGYATLSSGGPGFQNVKISAKSQRGHGFNFIIEIYGV